MDNKMTRYGTRIFTLDRNSNTNLWCWNETDINNFLEKENKRYGLKIINNKSEIKICVEYSNIIWEYRLYFGSFKKRFKILTENDDRWSILEEFISNDLKVMGLEFLKEQIIIELKNKNYFEYNKKINEQFKNYCV